MLRENPLLTGSSDRQLAFGGIEFENHERIDLEFVHCRGFDGDGLPLPARLKVKRGAIPDELNSRGSARDRVEADVPVQNFRADIERVEAGDLKRPIPVNVENDMTLSAVTRRSASSRSGELLSPGHCR